MTHLQTHAAPANALGPVLSEHRGTMSAGGWMWWYLGLMCIAAGAFAAVKGIDTGSTDKLLTALGCAGAALVLLASPVLRWRQRVVCCANGLTWHRLLGDKTVQRGDFTDVRLVHHRSKYGAYSEVELHTRRGKLSIKGIAHPEQVVNHVRAWLRGPAIPAHARTRGGGWQPPV